MSVEGSAAAEAFGICLKDVFCPALRRRQWMAMDNLLVHKGKHVRDLVKERG
jgi:hypothetical protein